MTKKLASSLLLLFASIVHSPARADEYLFVTLEFPPLEYIGENGHPEGIAVDVVRRVMSSLGDEVHIEVYPWARALEMAKKGDAAAIFTAYKTPERATFLDYSAETLIPQVVGLYAKKDSPVVFNGDLDTIRDKRIGVVSTISYGPKFDQIRDRLSIHSVKQLEQNFEMLLADRIDLFISNIYVAEWILQKEGLNGRIIRLPQHVERVPSYIGFSKQRALTHLRDRFDSELIRLKSSGEYNDIVSHYGVTLP